MAKMTYKMPEDFLTKVSKLGKNTDDIMPKVLKAGGEQIEKKIHSNLVSVIGQGTKTANVSTGQLAQSLHTSKAWQDDEGNHNVKVGFSGIRTDATSNALVAGVLEYGKSGQPPKPFVKPAKTAAKNACIEAMQQALECEVNKL